MSELKPCPYRVHGERTASLTVPGEYFYRETFEWCIGERCPCFSRIGNSLMCNRDFNTVLILATLEDK